MFAQLLFYQFKYNISVWFNNNDIPQHAKTSCDPTGRVI